MNGPELFEPLQGPSRGWPSGSSKARDFLCAFAAQGSKTFVANLTTDVLGLLSGSRVLPVTVNDGPEGDCYVCLPHSAYALYAKDELRIVDAGPLTPALKMLADAVGRLFRAAGLGRMVHINNWLLSTNLHGDWHGEDIAEIRALLAGRYPKHFLAVRSLNYWSCGELLERLKVDGWVLLPSRQIYVTDDLLRDWAPRRDTKADKRLLANTSYRFDLLDTLQPGDAERIAELYGMLYLQRYSHLNPAYTADFIALTHAKRILSYRGLRDSDGRLAAVVGAIDDGQVLTTPILGYDTTRPQSDGLYRMACVLLSEMALKKGLRLHSSAGAAEFKRLRGARPELEYWAFHAGHLAPTQRAILKMLRGILVRVAVPLMRAKGY